MDRAGIRGIMKSAVALGDRFVDGKITMLVALTILAGNYFEVTVRTALHNNLWADEVLCISVARLQSYKEILSAIWMGSEYSPPTYDLLMHYFLVAAVHVPPLLADRFPAILGVFIAAVAVFCIMYPRVGRMNAVLAAGIVLGTGPFLYAIQARPYGMLICCLSLALYVWTKIDGENRRIKMFFLWFFMSLAALLHFYGFFYVVAIGCCEAVHMLVHRKCRWTVILPLLATIPVMLSLYPLEEHIAIYLASDIPSVRKYLDYPGYRLFTNAAEFVLDDDGFLTSLVHRILVLALAFFFIRRFAMGWGITFDLPPGQRKVNAALGDIEIIILSLFITMLFAFGFTYFVSKSFAPRYILGVALLPALLIPLAINKLRDGRLVALLLVTLTLPHHIKAMGAVKGDDTKIANRQDVLPFLKAEVGNSDLPIVIDSPDFLALQYGADPQMQPRIVSLMTPNLGPQPSLPSDLQLKRLTDIFKDMTVYDFNKFTMEHPKFYIVSFNSEYVAGSIEESLDQRHMLGPQLANTREAYLRCAGKVGVKVGCN